MEAMKETILIIEDDAGLVELLNEKIQEQGFQTANVNSAKEAFDWLKNQTPSLILLDYNLPDKNGKEFIADLMSEYEAIPPFILATGQGDERIAVEMMKLGARDYIVKDSNFLELMPIVITRVCKEVQNELKIRQIELALIESNQFNKQIVASAQEGIVVYDKDLKFLTWNPFMEELTGVPASDVIGKHVSRFSPLLEDVGILDNVIKALEGVIGPDVEFFHYYPASGKAVWLSDSISILRNTENEIIGVISTIRDITGRKKAEEETIKLGKHYQAIIENAPDGFVLLNSEGKFKYFSPSALKMFGYSSGDELIEIPDQLTYPDDLPLVLSTLDELFKNPGLTPTIVYRFKHKNGIWIWIESTFSNLLNDPAVEALVINFRDITERKYAEVALRESEDKFRSIAEQTTDLIAITDIDGVLQYVSPSCKSIFGFEAEEMTGRNFVEFLDGSSIEKATTLFRDTLKFNKRVVDLELTLRRKDGSHFIGELNRTDYEQGSLKGSLMIVRDITERKTVEIERNQSRKSFKDLFDNAPIGYHEVDTEGRIVRINKTELNMLGYTAEEQIGQYVWKNTIDEQKSIKSTQDKLNGHCNSVVKPFERDIRRKDGSTITVSIQDRVLHDNSGNIIGIRSTIQDISEQKRIENELKKSQKDFKDLFDNAPIGYHEIDAEGRITRINQTELNMLGFSYEELIGQFVWSIAHNPDEIQLQIREKLNGKKTKPTAFETSLMSKNGLIYSVLIQDRVLRDGDGNITGIRSTVQDITERKKAEEAVIQAKQSYFDIFNSVSEAIYVVDESGCFIEVNKGAERMYQRSREELIGLTPELVSAPGLNDIGNIQKLMKRSYETGVPANFDFWAVRKDGVVFLKEVFVNKGKYFDKDVLLATARDVTERKLMENELRESEERYKSITENSNSAIFIVNDLCKIEWVNQYVLTHSGYTFEQILNAESFVSFVSPESLEFATSNFMKVLAGEEYEHQYKLSVMLNSGEKRLFEKFMTHFVDRYGKLKVIVIMNDITERMIAENALKQSKDVLNKLLYANTEFIDSNTYGIDYTKLTDTILEISGAKYATFNLLSEDYQEFTTVAISGIADIASKVKSIFGYDLSNKKWKADPQKELKIKNNVITRFDTIYELAQSVLPKGITVMLEKLFKVGETYVVKITKAEKTIGDFVLIFAKGNKIQHTEIIELFANQVGLYIDRDNADSLLRNSEEKYRYLFANNPQPMYICDIETLDFLEVNQSLIDSYGYSREEFLKMKISDIHPNEDIPKLLIDVQDNNKQHKLAGEWRHIKKDGSIINVDITTVSIISNGRKARHVLVQDITLRKKAEDELKNSFSLLNATLESTADGIMVVDLKGTPIIFNNKFIEMWNVPESVIATKNGRDFLESVVDKLIDSEEFASNVRYLYNNQGASSVDTVSLKDGRIFERYSIPQRIASSIVGRVWSFRDITENKRAEEALRVSEEKFRSITEQISDYISICDLKGVIQYASPASKMMFQYEPDEIQGHHFVEFIVEECLPTAYKVFNNGVNQKIKAVDVELELKRKDGSTFFAELNGTSVVFGNENRILVIVHDITHRKKAENALRESEDKYRTMIEYSNDLIWALDSKGKFTFLNRMGLNTAEINFDEWIGKPFASFVFSEDLPMLDDVFQRTMGGENCTYELRFKKSENAILTISVNTSPIYNNGIIEGVVSFGRDITERKKAEEALRASEELYRNLVQRIPDGVYKSTSDGKFVDVNPAMIHMLGYDSKEELMAIDIKTQLYFDEADRESLVLDELYEETGVYQLKRKDGTGIWIEDHGWYNVDESGNVLFHEGVLRDITERKISELALQEKMDELMRFHNLTIDREMMMIELKREVNRILVHSGQPSKYKIVE